MAWKHRGSDVEILTMREVAAMLGVSPRTAAKLADSGKLACWTVPESRHRRFARAEVEAFRERHGIPVLAGGEG